MIGPEPKGRVGDSAPPVLGVRDDRGREGARAWGLWTLLTGVILVMAVLYFFPPQEHGFYPRCGLYAMTGLHCPGCGSLRAVHHLTHGRWLEALHANALLVVGLGGMIGVVVLGGGRGRLRVWLKALQRPLTPAVLLLLLVAFGVARNLPWPPFHWLAP